MVLGLCRLKLWNDGIIFPFLIVKLSKICGTKTLRYKLSNHSINRSVHIEKNNGSDKIHKRTQDAFLKFLKKFFVPLMFSQESRKYFFKNSKNTSCLSNITHSYRSFKFLLQYILCIFDFRFIETL